MRRRRVDATRLRRDANTPRFEYSNTHLYATPTPLRLAFHLAFHHVFRPRVSSHARANVRYVDVIVATVARAHGEEHVRRRRRERPGFPDVRDDVHEGRR